MGSHARRQYTASGINNFIGVSAGEITDGSNGIAGYGHVYKLSGAARAVNHQGATNNDCVVWLLASIENNDEQQGYKSFHQAG